MHCPWLRPDPPKPTSSASRTTPDRPRPTSASAAISPLYPPPTIATSTSIDPRSVTVRGAGGALIA